MEKKMVTIHITEFKGYHWKEKTNVFLSSFTKQEPKVNPEMRFLVKELYDKILHLDPLFHYFYEPEIIFRISQKEIVEALEKELKSRSIDYIVYDYPHPKDEKKDIVLYGEEKDGIVSNHQDSMLSIFHHHSNAAIKMNEKEFMDYMERVIHSGFNMRSCSKEEEGKNLLKLAVYKLGKQKALRFLKDFE